MSQGRSVIEEISEAEAAGRIAELYEDIRKAQGLPLVNLIWRHLATRPAALEWAWAIARPLYASGIASSAAATHESRISLPALPVLPRPVPGALGLSERDLATITSIFRAYNRGNGLNLVALSAIVAPGVDAELTLPPLSRAPDGDDAPLEEVPPIPALGELSATTSEMVLALNEFGTRGSSDPIVASLYRHLGYWPAYLALVWQQLVPLEEDGRLAGAVLQIRESGERFGAALVQHCGGAPATDAADIAFAEGAIERFRDAAICRMVAIGLMLYRTLP